MIQRIFLFSLLCFSVAACLCVAALSGCGELRGGSDIASQMARQEALEQRSLVSAKKKTEMEFYSDYNEACRFASQEKKPIMLFFYLPNCVFCQQMMKETFTDVDVVKLSQQFVCIQVDVSREEKLREMYDVNVMPTVQFMNAQGILLQRISAKKNPNQLLVQMQIAIESLAVRGNGKR